MIAAERPDDARRAARGVRMAGLRIWFGRLHMQTALRPSIAAYAAGLPSA